MLGEVGMAVHAPEIHQKAFENSYGVVFLFEDDKLIGMGRSVSDGAYEASLYDIAVLPSRQGEALGRCIVETLMEELDGLNVILFASPGKQGFYHKFGFKDLKTGVIRFVNEGEMREIGFID